MMMDPAGLSLGPMTVGVEGLRVYKDSIVVPFWGSYLEP